MAYITTLNSYVFSHEGALYRFTRESEIVGQISQPPRCYLACEGGFQTAVGDDSLPAIRKGIEELSRRLPV